MKRFFKIIGALIGGLIVLAALVLTGLYGYDQYKQNTFKPIEDVDGVYLGMPRGDLLFQTDLKMECDPVEVAAKDCEFYRYGDLLLNSRVLAKGYIRLRNDKVASISRHSEMIRDIANQVYTTDMLLKKLGDPDVLIISPDLTRRAYMYVKEALAFNYNKDSLTSFYWGGMSISDIGITSRKRIPENLRNSPPKATHEDGRLTLEYLRWKYGDSDSRKSPRESGGMTEQERCREPVGSDIRDSVPESTCRLIRYFEDSPLTGSDPGEPVLKVPETYGGASVIVDGIQVCPGDTCPFEEGDTFPEFTKMKLYSAEEMRKFLSD